MNKTSYFVLSLGCTFAFCLGFFQTPSPSLRTLAQNKELAEYLTYEQIPCPTQEEITTYIKTAHFKDVAYPVTCDSSPMGKAMRLFKLASLLQIQLPVDWAISHEKMITQSLEYISTTTPEVTLSDVNPRAIASNLVGQIIHIGAAFFELPPLKGLEVLIHENRHSFPYEPGHTKCRTGDISKTSFACDHEYSKGIYTGAYSAGTIWSLAHSLYSTNLGPRSRKSMMNSALSMIATRFNKVPEGMAVPLDLLFVLDDQGKVFQVHPFTFELSPLTLNVPQNDKIIKIQYDPLESGFLAFTEQGRILQLTSHYEQTQYQSGFLLNDVKYVDSNKAYTPTSDFTHTYFVTDEGLIYMRDIDQNKLTKYFDNLPFLTKKIFAGLENQIFLLSLEGNLHHVLFGLRRTAPLFPSTKNTLWVDATGGSSNDVLYAVNANDGFLYYKNTFKNSSDVDIEVSDFVISERLQKFQEGMNIKIGMSESGNLWAWDYLRSLETPWKLPLSLKVVDFALGRRYAITSEPPPTSFVINAWSLQCNARPSFREPWSLTQMGINPQGELVFEGLQDKKCLSSTEYYKFLTPPINVRGTPLGQYLNYFSQTYLELHKKNGESFKIMPYHLPIREF